MQVLAGPGGAFWAPGAGSSRQPGAAELASFCRYHDRSITRSKAYRCKQLANVSIWP